MKKALALLLVISLGLGLVACKKSPANTPATTAATEAVEAAPTAETTAATEEAVTEATAVPVETHTVTCEDLTMTVVTNRLEDKTEEWDNGATGCYVVNNKFAVMASREDSSSIAGDPDLETYINVILQTNDFDSEVAYHDEIPYFTYTNDEFTFIVTVHKGTNSYWFLQTYCATENFSELEPQIWDVLTTVQIG